jgi:hypothetical protein
MCLLTDDFWIASFSVSADLTDLNSLTWAPASVLSSLKPGPRTQHRLAAALGQLYLFGGLGPQLGSAPNVLDDLWLYKPLDQTWTPLTPTSSSGSPPVGRYAATFGARPSLPCPFSLLPRLPA